jgi:DNA modification methylase
MSHQTEQQFDIEWWPIDRPLDYPKNARKWSPEAVSKVAQSIMEYGWKQPLVCDSNDVIIIGHLRRAAGRQAGMIQCPVLVAHDLSPEQVRGLRLMDNRSHEESRWDFELLGPELIDLQRLGFGLELTGFDEDELVKAMGPASGLTDPDDCPPPPESPVTIPGDIWVMGNHRVLCADSTDCSTTERFIGPQKADMVFIDPPYNVDYQGYTKENLTMLGDSMSPEQFASFLHGAFASCFMAIKPGASLYVCHASSCQREFQNALEAAGFEIRCQIIWAKNTFAWGFGRYKFQREPLFYCHVAGQSDPWYGDKSQSTLWQENKPAASRLHPTTKPTELVTRALINSSKAGDVVADFFGGSGSTLIACESTNRICRMVEIDPKYVDVIVTRWIQFIGHQAIHEVTGATFEQMKSQRLQNQKPIEEKERGIPQLRQSD